MSARELRPYQHEAVAAVEEAWSGGMLRPSVVMATGLGKSTVIAAIAARAARSGARVILLAHRAELLTQMADTVAVVAPDLPPVGVVRGTRNDGHENIVVASFQTLGRERRMWAVGHRDVVIVDECHHAPAATYRTVLEELGAFDGSTRVCGFTATMRREDGYALGDIWEAVVFERNLRWAIREGYLVPPTGLTVHIPGLDLARVRTVAGDYQSKQLEEVMEAATDSVVDATLRFAAHRRPLVFAAGVDSAHTLAAALTEAGVAAEAVTGQLTAEERERVYVRYRAGETRALVTVQVLTEGADFPVCDAVIMARPTKSHVLYAQMVGRALRRYPGKDDALVLDLAGHTRSLGLVTLPCLEPEAFSRTVDLEGNDVEPEEDVLPEPVARMIRSGPLQFIPVDLLAATEAVWLQTPAGVMFTPAGEHAVFLWPPGSETNVQVGVIRVRGDREGGWVTPEPVELVEAMMAAEDTARELGGLARRSASWRTNQPPSVSQLRFARTLGVREAESMTKARLSDEISIALTARRLDDAARGV